jgi:hypothetical protein
MKTRMFRDMSTARPAPGPAAAAAARRQTGCSIVRAACIKARRSRPLHHTEASIMPKTALRVITLAGIAALAACGGSGGEVADRYRPVQLAEAPAMRVNGYLWQAALDTIKFMPIASTDATGGVIVTDWYINPGSPAERTKVIVNILDSRLRADALRVTVNRQMRTASGDWVDAPVQQATVAGLEDAILVRARQIRIGTVTEAED